MEKKKSNIRRLYDYSPDRFFSGALVTDPTNTIVYINSYFQDYLFWSLESLVGENVNKILTKSSRIFFQSYLIPTLLHEKNTEELQLIIFNGDGDRVPVSINACMDDDGFTFWSLTNASKRDKLYEELIKTRKKLEDQAEKLKDLAATDELTSLLNRREMNLRSELLLQQSKRSKLTVGLIMIDIDDFKLINDNYGHLEGDRVLKELGRILKNSGRKTDLISRYGGEEFLIMLPDTNQACAFQFCQRLHKQIAAISLNDKPITVSIGISLSKKDTAFISLFNQADKAVYKAKALGKNRTHIYSDD